MLETLVLLGSSESGKTALAHRITDDVFLDEYSATMEDEFLAEFVPAPDQPPLPLNLLDTAGDEQFFRASVKDWLATSQAVLLVYSSTSSLHWALEVVKTYLIDPKTAALRMPFAFVGTKRDLLSENAQQEQDTTAQAWARYYCCPSVRVSSKSNCRTDFHPLLAALAREALDDPLNGLVRSILGRSIAVSELLQGQENSDFLEFSSVMDGIRFVLRARVDAPGVRERGGPVLSQQLEDCLERALKLITQYHLTLKKLTDQGRVKKLFAGNRLQRGLEKISYALDSEKNLIDKLLRQVPASKSSGPADSIYAPAPSNAIAPSKEHDDQLRLLIEDDDAYRFWVQKFGAQCYKVDASSLFQALGGKADHFAAFSTVLDPSQTSFVNVYKFAGFIRGFGPLNGALHRCHNLLQRSWFVNYKTNKESEKLLAGQAAKAPFLIRFSRGKPGCFSIAYIPCGKEKVVHARIGHAKLDQFKGTNKGAAGGACSMNKTVFSSLDELINRYRQEQVLGTPLFDPVAKLPYFHGDMDIQEAEETLSALSIGSYLLRFEKEHGYHLCLSFKGKKNKCFHRRLQRARTGNSYIWRLSPECAKNDPLQQSVEQGYSSVSALLAAHASILKNSATLTADYLNLTEGYDRVNDVLPSDESTYGEMPQFKSQNSAVSHPQLNRQKHQRASVGIITEEEEEEEEGKEEDNGQLYGHLRLSRQEENLHSSQYQAPNATPDYVNSPVVASSSVSTSVPVVFLSHASIQGRVYFSHSGQAVVKVNGKLFPHASDLVYQLTSMSGFQPLFVAEEWSENTGHFIIGGGEPGKGACWSIFFPKAFPQRSVPPLAKKSSHDYG